MASCELTPRPSSYVERSPVPLGFSPGYSLLEASPDRLRSDLDDMRAVGVKRLRIDIPWAKIQPTIGNVNWAPIDQVIRAARDRGFNILGILWQEPGWAVTTNSAGQRNPVSPERYRDFVDAATKRYADDVFAWEIWNEPNLRRFWESGPSAVEYADIVKAAAPRIRANDPDAPVLAGAMAPGDGSSEALSPIDFLRTLYDNVGRQHFDAVSIHPYSYPEMSDLRSPSEWNTFYRMEKLHDIMTNNGDGDARLWITEYGAATGTDEQSLTPCRQADMIVRGVREARSRDYVGPMYLYSLRDAGGDEARLEDNFGILEVDSTPKPAYGALRQEIAATQP